MGSENIVTISEPSLEKTLRVEQRAFGYLFKRAYKEYLETLSIADCVGVYAKSSNLSALLHVDIPWATLFLKSLKISERVKAFLDYLEKVARKYCLDSSFESIIVESVQTFPRHVDEVYSTLQEKGVKIKNVIRSRERSANVIFDKYGEAYWIDSRTIKNYDSWWYGSKQNLRNDGLKCMNTGEIILNR